MNAERFRNSPSGRLLKAGQGDAAYRAFVPNALPPALTLDAELVRILSEADRALGELAGLGRTMPNPDLLIRPFIRREAVLSSRIEGTQTDITDLYLYEARQMALPGMKPAPSDADAREVLNYVRALEYGLERVQTLPVSLRLVRELHKRLMEGVRGERATPGEFRRSQNWIGKAGCTLNDADYIPPPVPEMNDALDAFEKYLHSGNDHPPLVRDGNGRIGRLLLSLLLVNWKLLPLPLLYLSAFFERNRRDYYDLLRAVSESGAWREWLAFFLRGVAEQSREANQMAKKLQDLQLKWRSELQKTHLPALVLGIADHLFQQPFVSAAELQEQFGISHPTAMQSLKRLVDKGILKEITGKERHRRYVAEQVLQIVE
ncbi:MAG: Fic family protein [Chloroflexi bacterium]|nr:Fic family protein [Chloroflexota bacterium]